MLVQVRDETYRSSAATSKNSFYSNNNKNFLRLNNEICINFKLKTINDKQGFSFSSTMMILIKMKSEANVRGKSNQTRFSTPMKCNKTIYIGFQRT